MPAILAGTNTAVTALPGDAWRVAKTGGVEGSYDAAAASESAIAGDFALRVIDLTPDNSILFGVSTDPHGNDGFEAIDFAMWFYQLGAYLFESGVHMPPPRPQAGIGWITRSAGTLRCHIGSRPSAANAVRTVTGVSGPLWFDCTITRVGGAFSARFDAPGAWSAPARRGGALSIGIGG